MRNQDRYRRQGREKRGEKEKKRPGNLACYQTKSGGEEGVAVLGVAGGVAGTELEGRREEDRAFSFSQHPLPPFFQLAGERLVAVVVVAVVVGKDLVGKLVVVAQEGK